MKMFFTASYKHKATYQKYYDLVLKTIQSQSVELRSPELDSSFSSPTSTNHYQSIKQGITWADAVIFEISHAGFQLGHEATLAIQNKKHVLCLSIHEDYSKRIINRYFHGAKYSELNIDDIISDFISSLRHHQFDQRFNCFLSQKQLEKVGLNATKLGLTKSDYIRQLIDSQSKIL
ncbi:MAG: hypothetical protein WAV41_02340 [Microgenomates group bacterium]